MNLRKNIMMVVSVMVAVIIALSVLVPVIQDSSASEDTFTNEGYYRMSHIDDTTPDISISWNHTAPTTLNINGNSVKLPETVTYDASIITASDWSLKFATLSNSRYEVGLITTTGSLVYSASTQSNTDMDIVLSGGTATFDNGSGSTYTRSYSELYVISDDGDYVMKKATENVYLNADSIIIGNGRTALAYSTPASINLYVEGSIEDNVIATVYNPAGGTGYVVNNYVLNYSEVTTHDDLYSFESVNFDVTNANNETKTATYSQVIVPYEVTAERSVHVSTIEASLLGIIPLLVVIGIVIGAVWFIRQRN